MQENSSDGLCLRRRTFFAAAVTAGTAFVFGTITPSAYAEGPEKFELVTLQGQTVLGTEGGSTVSLPAALGCRIRVFDEDVAAGVRLLFKWDSRCYRHDTLSLVGSEGRVAAVRSVGTMTASGDDRSIEIEVSDSLVAGAEYVLLLGAAVTPTLETAVPVSARGLEVEATAPGDTGSTSLEESRSARGAAASGSQWGVKAGVVWRQRMWKDAQLWVWEPASVVVTAYGSRATPEDLKIILHLDGRYTGSGSSGEPYVGEFPVGSLDPGEARTIACELPELFLSGDLEDFASPVVSCVSAEGLEGQVRTGQESFSREDSVYNAALLEFFRAG